MPPEPVRRPRRIRSGFTLVELAVVMAVVAVLASLILGGVLASRAAARRVQCQNNLRQVGLAVIDFADARGAYPGSRELDQPVPWDWFADGQAPHTHLLGRLDRPNLEETYWRWAPLTEVHRPPWNTYDPILAPVPTFLCPADGAAGTVPDGSGGTNVRFNTGGGVYTFDADEPDLIGPFGEHRGGPASVRDGLSNTACASEKLIATDPGVWNPLTDAWATGLWRVDGGEEPTPSAEIVRFCAENPPAAVAAGRYFAHAGGTWCAPSHHYTWYNHAATPNASPPDCDLSHNDARPSGGVYRATSAHRGGVNLLLLDGSVRFVADGISGDVWVAVGSMAGGEAAGF